MLNHTDDDYLDYQDEPVLIQNIQAMALTHDHQEIIKVELQKNIWRFPQKAWSSTAQYSHHTFLKGG